MKKAQASITLTAIFATFIMLTTIMVGLAQQNPSPILAPRNRAFVNYFSATLHEIGNSGIYGLVPAPVDLSHARGKRILREGPTILALPSAYDLRTANPPRLPPVR